MKRHCIWKILLLTGVFPFLIPVILGIYKISAESWQFLDWLVMYSFVYWPTYLIGIVLIVISAAKLIK